MKEEIAALWKEVFNDSDEFIKLFFDNVYKPENTFVVKHDNRIVSALQIVFYKLKINDLILDAAYICGVCTRVSERGKGFMRRLMNEAMEEIGKKGCDFSFLIPAEPRLFDVYRKSGFIFDIAGTNRRVYPTRNSSIVNIISCNSDHYSYFNKKQLERKCCILHDYKDFGVILQENQIDKGQVFVALYNREPAGIVFAKPVDNETVTITEILYDDEMIKDALINHVGKYFNSKNINCILPHGLACIPDKNILPDTGIYMTLMLN